MNICGIKIIIYRCVGISVNVIIYLDANSYMPMIRPIVLTKPKKRRMFADFSKS